MHRMISLLIAGTYTPLLLVTIGGTLGWTLFIIVWLLAIAGIVYKSLAVDKHNVASAVALSCDVLQKSLLCIHQKGGRVINKLRKIDGIIVATISLPNRKCLRRNWNKRDHADDFRCGIRRK
jgi:hypothetical protein